MHITSIWLLTISTTNVQLSFYDRLYLSSPLMAHVGLFVSFRQDSTEEVFRKPSPWWQQWPSGVNTQPMMWRTRVLGEFVSLSWNCEAVIMEQKSWDKTSVCYSTTSSDLHFCTPITFLCLVCKIWYLAKYSKSARIITQIQLGQRAIRSDLLGPIIVSVDFVSGLASSVHHLIICCQNWSTDECCILEALGTTLTT